MILRPEHIFIFHAAASLFLTGLIWFVQLVHYPLLREIKGYNKSAYEFTRLRLTTWVFAPAMLLEAGTGLWLMWKEPELIQIELQWLGVGLLGIIWIATFVQSTRHHILAISFNEKVHGRLLRINWLRTGAWSARAVLVLYILCELF